MVLAYPGEVSGLDGWKRVAETLNKANNTLNGQGLHAGYHNHDAEWKPVDGQKPMEVLAAALDKSIMLQLDVGTCLAAGSDPVAWINRNPGRIRSMHLKDWSPAEAIQGAVRRGDCPVEEDFRRGRKSGGNRVLLDRAGRQRLP